MASAVEILGSRTGGSAGQFGIQNQTTLWEVTLDASGAASLDSTSPENYLAANYVPLGTPYPWADVPAFASEYTRLETPAPLIWHVLVLYLPPLVVDFTTRWRVSVQTMTESKISLVDRNDVPFGPRVYYENKGGEQDSALATAKGFEVTTPYESRHEQDGIRRWWAMGNNPTSARAFGRRAVERQILKRVGQLNIRKRIANLSDAQVGGLQSMNTYLNKYTWMGARSGSLQQMGCVVDEADGVLNESRIPGKVWDIELLYRWDSEGIEAEFTTVDTISSGDGTEAVVIGNLPGSSVTIMKAFADTNSTYMRNENGKVVTYHGVYPRIDFVANIAGIIGSAPAGIDG